MSKPKRRERGAATPAAAANAVSRTKSGPLPLSTAKFLLLVAAILALVSVAHRPALDARALSFDDQPYLTENPLVRNPSWASTRRFLTEVLEPSTVHGYYHPLSMISLMLDSAMGGGPEALRPFHRTSLLLHLANTALVALILRSLFGNAWVAALVALLFGAHPLTVEPIPWVGERKTVLAAFFVFLSLLTYLRYARGAAGGAARKARDRRPRLWLGATFGLFVLALLAKPTSTPLPLLLLLLDIWPLGRFGKPALLEKIPFFFLAVISSWVTFESQRRTASAVLPSEQAPGRIPLTLCHNIVFYLRKLLWPSNLSSFYPVPRPLDLSQPAVVAGVVGTAILMVFLVLSLRRTRAWAVGWLFFFIAIFPTMGVIGFTIVIASDKYAYMPMLGLLLPVTWQLGRWWAAPPRSARPRRTLIVGIALVAAVAETAATRAYYSQWRDSERLYQHMVSLAPESPALLARYGSHLLQTNRTEEAIPVLQKALTLDPKTLEARVNLGKAYFNQRRYAEAADVFQEILKLKPDHARAHGNLGVSLRQLGRLPEAEHEYREAIRLEPDYTTPRRNLANLLRDQGKLDAAAAELKAALVINPFDAPTHNSLGAVFFRLGQLDEAAAEFRESMRLDRDDPESRANLALTLAGQGQADGAAAAWAEVLALAPGDAVLHRRAGDSLLGLGRIDAAVKAYRTAIALDPTNTETPRLLATAEGRLAAAPPDSTR